MRLRGWWVLATLVPFGLGSWAGFAYAARRACFGRWYVWSAVYGVLSVGGFVLNGEAEDDSTLSGVGAALVIVPWRERPELDTRSVQNWVERASRGP